MSGSLGIDSWTPWPLCMSMSCVMNMQQVVCVTDVCKSAVVVILFVIMMIIMTMNIDDDEYS